MTVTDEGTLISRNPATLAEVGRSPSLTGGALDAVIARARAAQPAWAADLPARRAALRAAAEAITAATGELVPLLTAEQGKPLAEAGQELWVAGHAFATLAGTDWEPEERITASLGRPVTVQHRPYGVVAAIVPWNFPVYLAAAKIAPALLAGNTVVVKPAESVSLAVAAFVDVLRSALPEGVVETLTGGPETGRQLIDHPDVRMVSFTGSTAVGRSIMAQAAATLTPVALELGGNDPAVLLPDADLDDAAARLAAGAFLNAGQMCIAPKRIYVPDPLVEVFAEALAAQAQRTVGDGADPATTMGPLHNARQLEIAAGMLGRALDSGARTVTGGVRGHALPGHFLDPTVLVGADDGDDIVRQEQFGPVLPVVGYRDLDALLAMLNAQEFGLGASVWSADSGAAAAVAGRIDAGTVWINQHNALDVALPFGGVKASGFGREGGVAGVWEFTTARVLDPRPAQ
ncbi:aldehyde dehydrogenase family protein [Tomitella fengzijianii]|uniref:Aldehyde dehydrogenase family protein n=1 Tax=Tomitella fengzijianii TaxID=2597660 RepID=A0A516X5T0_9ACTN|nr:aldehyde dehydrogenase family protein [Tomitella fengzijianii]QDQ98425.1 aldehyde dehydrogenase family protein [Tomitella fengzijianii]